MTAHQIEAVLFDLAGTLTAARPAQAELTLLPQAVPTLQRLAQNGISTGVVLDRRDRQLNALQALVNATACSDSQLRPLPAPDLPATLAVRLKAQTFKHCVLVSGSADGIRAGLNAGLWTIGTALSGALDRHGSEHWTALSGEEQDRIRLQATMALMNAGAHYVIDNVAELDSCLHDIELRQAKA
ncbi:MAG: hypothetical protein VW877_02420 [Pseudomonadaceae bacterium]